MKELASALRVIAQSLLEAAAALEAKELIVELPTIPESTRIAPDPHIVSPRALPSQNDSRPRKRGHPRKNEPPMTSTITSEWDTCDICNRQFPTHIIAVHITNCAAAQRGYINQK